MKQVSLAAVQSEVTKQLAALAAVDPHKGSDGRKGKGKGGGKGSKGKGGKGKGRGANDSPEGQKSQLVIPRDSDGKILRWVDGMQPCVCGANHLYSECPDPNTKPPRAQSSMVVAGLGDGDLTAQLHDFFDNARPSTIGAEFQSAHVSPNAVSAPSRDDEMQIGPQFPEPQIKCRTFDRVVNDKSTSQIGPDTLRWRRVEKEFTTALGSTSGL